MIQDRGEFLSVEQRQWTTSTNKNDTYCKLIVSIARYDSASPEPTYVWTWDMRGPGLIFTDGYWHEQPTKISAKVDRVRLLPPSFYPFDQVLITHFEQGKSASRSFLRVIAFKNAYGNDIELLDLSAAGKMNYSIDGTTISVQSSVGGVTLKFDSEVKAFAIVNPQPASIAAFRYLKTHKFDESGG
jgi:hypothetical protein